MMIRMICDSHKRIDYGDITKLKFFKSVNWRNIRKSPAPFVPQLSSDIDTRHFDQFDEVIEDAVVTNTVKKLGNYINVRACRACILKN
mmetsp:Transcript_39155/g.62727  ORF Transcript_39155/g.62727 Transcript_39155/m.62727 type:complete len:88 (-) Transcript_39155:397-660(-)